MSAPSRIVGKARFSVFDNGMGVRWGGEFWLLAEVPGALVAELIQADFQENERVPPRTPTPRVLHAHEINFQIHAIILAVCQACGEHYRIDTPTGAALVARHRQGSGHQDWTTLELRPWQAYRARESLIEAPGDVALANRQAAAAKLAAQRAGRDPGGLIVRPV